MSATLVKTRYGKVEGIKDGTVYIWKGIPYAAPPINSLRFRAPQEPEPWGGVLETKKFGPAALQLEREAMVFLGDSPTHRSEDCLYLNIWSPRADDRRRPVMVWIHGGSFISGSGSSFLYDGKSFAEQGDVVVVTINYRLGVFGFLHLDGVGGGEYSASGNCGLLDQAVALKWVNENIEAFGGDPNNVTIFGESAGSVCVGCLLTLPSAKGLFSKAILQSGTPKSSKTTETATKVAEQVLSALQVRKDELFKLENIPAETILDITEDLPTRIFGPVSDGVTLPKNIQKVFCEGFAKDIPILIGTTAEEWRLFTHFDPNWEYVNEKNLIETLGHVFGRQWPEISRYFLGEGSISKAIFEDIMTFAVFTFPSIYLSECQVKNGAPVWMYRFDYPSAALGGNYKAFHALEIPFVWNIVKNKDTERITGNAPDCHQLAHQMHQAWIAFAHHGDPNTTELPHWPKYDLEDRSTMLFNVKSEVVKDPNGQWRSIWENTSPQ
jgi:para-nitrobenzyl esterase